MNTTDEDELRALRKFYLEIVNMTIAHDVIGDSACVTANRLSGALSKVDDQWWRHDSKGVEWS